MHDASPSLLQTADRALRVLQEFRRPGDEHTVASLSRALALNRSTASRLVTTLATRGFLARGPGDTVHLGPELVRLGALAGAGDGLVSLARPVLAELASATGEAATLAVASGDQVLTVAEAEGRHFVALRSWVGTRTPAHCTADGKVLLAFGALAPARAGDDQSGLEAELAAARSSGWAASRGELEAGLNGVAAPVLSGGVCVAAVCVSGPSYRLDEDGLAAIGATVRQSAGRIADALSAPAPAPADREAA